MRSSQRQLEESGSRPLQGMDSGGLMIVLGHTGCGRF